MKCPSCQNEFAHTANFCPQCGQELKTLPRFTPFSTSERKRITSLFTDISGYSAITEQIDPEDVKEITNQIFDGVREIVKKYGGAIERFAGDGVLILFGVPRVHEDDPVRAIRAAREIHEFVEALSPHFESRAGRSLSMHSGINTGLAVTGNAGPEEGAYGVTGDAVNVASRLSDLATAGEILVGSDSYKATRTLFAFQHLDSIKIRGRIDPVSIYRVISESSDVIRPDDTRVYSEMVGRDRELHILEHQVIKACEGCGSVINVVGEAGIGKSRLIAELKKREIMRQAQVLEGRAISIGKNLSFYPIIDVIKQWANIAENDSQTVAFAKLEKAVRSVHPKELEEILPFVSIMMGMRLTGKYAERIRRIEGEALEKLVAKNLRELIIKATKQMPIVFIIEDLHWADRSSVELLYSLYPLAPRQRLVFINVFRPGYMEDRNDEIHAVGQRFPSQYLEIALQPLKRIESETLIKNMLKLRRIPFPLQRRIVDCAGGNPFFIEEVIRSLIEEGVIVRRNGGFELTSQADSVGIPPTINHVLMARIDRLDERTRELVRVASVIGRNFFDRILRNVADGIDNIDERLNYLKQIQLIRERIRMQEREYLFKHALAQEAAYESILLQQRRTLHLKVGRAIEDIFSERLNEFYGMLAYHYSRAEDLEKAEKYMVKAGEEALRSSASSEALNFFQEALRLYLRNCGDEADPDRIALFEKNIALAFFNKGQYAKAIGFFDSVLEHMGPSSSKNRIAVFFRLLFDLFHLIKSLYLPKWTSPARKPDERENEIFDLGYRRAIALVFMDSDRCFVELLSEIRRLSRYPVREVENGFGIWMSASGLFSWSGLSFQISRKILGYVSDNIIESDTKDLIYYNLFDILYKYFTGNWSDVREYNERLLDYDLRVGEFWHVSTCILFHGFISVCQGRFDDTRKIIRKLTEIWETYENEDAAEYQYSLRILLYLRTEKLEEAQKEVDSAILFVNQTERDLVHLFYLGLKAIVQVKRKDISGAQESVSHAREIQLKKGRIPPLYMGSLLLADLHVNLSLLKKAANDQDHRGISTYKKASHDSAKRALRNVKKNPCNAPEVFRLIGLHYWYLKKERRALKWWMKSLEKAEQLESGIERGLTHLLIAQQMRSSRTLKGKIQKEQQEEHLRKAKDLLTQVGFHSMLDQVE
jgi:class 3 adenylate cyclase/tetratricopeptide (TPR) repeat protein